MKSNQKLRTWTFWIDCGGTFTDIIGLNLDGSESHPHVHKILSHSPHYQSAVAQGIEDILGHNRFANVVKEVRLGTTVATNAFLERKGIPCALVTTLGQRDVLNIRQQNRPKLFDIPIRKISSLQKMTTQIYERVGPDGEVIIALDEEIAEFELKRIKDQGIKSVAISLLHSTKNPDHELRVGKIAKKLGFDYVSLSHQVSPQAKYISRSETTVFDAYLTPYLAQYTKELSEILKIENITYMQSDGSLCGPKELKGYNALLSGPAGGLIGALDIARNNGHKNIITFDMGGTSTDVAICQGEPIIDHEPNFHGLNLLAPMVNIHTVAAGGGSLLHYDEGRFRVGPESAGAHPGPACYGFGGPLTVTDANLFLGNLNPKNFPNVFGPDANGPLNQSLVKKKFEDLSQKIGLSAQEVANGFLDVAIETMARAVKKITIERGHDPQDFIMVSFGGAGGQLAAQVCQRLGIKSLLVHPYSSVLSAYGIGKAHYAQTMQGKMEDGFSPLKKKVTDILHSDDLKFTKYFLINPPESDFKQLIKAESFEEAKKTFIKTYQNLFGLELKEAPECETISLKGSFQKDKPFLYHPQSPKEVVGPHLISENKTTLVIPKGWSAKKDSNGLWLCEFSPNLSTEEVSRPAEVELEIFYQRFQFIAEEMGHTLQKLAKSVNIKERKDFSCALFTKYGELVANAPHIPVHLGSMGDVVTKIIKDQNFTSGDMFLSNSPQSGGTHLPDLTVVAPLFIEDELVMWVASRGHHADIGGISPGSMPGNSKSLKEEGVIIDSLKIVKEGKFDYDLLEDVLNNAPFPVRNFSLNLHDIKAKIAANHSGMSHLLEMYDIYSPTNMARMAEEVLSYSQKKIHAILEKMSEGIGEKIITQDRKILVSFKKRDDLFYFDFTGTSDRLNNNFNTPPSVVKAAVLFVLRCLIEVDIPLNSGIMRSIKLHIPKNCFLNPATDSAVVAGNVETSQALCDALFDCLNIMANSQGTMNNLSFGNDKYQYYETLGGGSGATRHDHGTSGVQVHMTNSLLTDPEVFESRFPVLIELMNLRVGSGGSGENIGGDGISRKLFFKEPMTVSMISQSRVFAPSGLNKGEAGQVGINLREDHKGTVERLPENFQMEFHSGDRLILDTPGGGGFFRASPKEITLIFGFGSNMDLLQIKDRCPSAQIITRAYAPNYELRYTRYSQVRKGGVADMMVSKGKKVTGILFSLSKSDLEVLDEIECGKNAYQRVPLVVYDDNGKEYPCHAYDVIDKVPDVAPQKIYEWLVFSGAYGLNVSQGYLDHIKSYRT